MRRITIGFVVLEEGLVASVQNIHFRIVEEREGTEVTITIPVSKMTTPI